MNNKSSYFSWGRVILVSLIVACTELMWTLYNTYVPLWLQAGNPAFDLGEGSTMVGFGFGAFITGIILTIDNIAALFISPIFGFISDSTRSKLGRRKPWIIFAAPFAILAFIFIPITVLRIPPELNGQSSQLTPYLIPFVITIILMVLPLAVMRTPANVIVYDITPSKHRTVASAIASLIGAASGIIGAILGAMLFDIHPGLPFWISAGLSATVISLVAFRIKEPEETEALPEGMKGRSPKDTLNEIRTLPKDTLKSLFFLYLSVFLSYAAFAQLQSFSSSYGVFVLGMDVNVSGLLYAVGGSAFILGTLPTGFITKRLKRKTAALIGFAIFAVMGLVIFLFPNPTLVWVAIGLGGFFWTFVWVLQDPMIMDSAPNNKTLGSLGGLLAVARTLGYIVGPIAGGFFVEKFSNNYSIIWLVLMAGSILGALCMLPVSSGEAKE